MNKNLVKQRVLDEMYKISIHDLAFDRRILDDDVFNKININRERVEEAIMSLSLEEFIRYESENGIAHLSFYHKGVNASIIGFFRSKNRVIVLNSLKEALLTIANILVAGAAIYALTKDSYETKELRNELKEVRLQQSTLEQRLRQDSTVRAANNYLLHRIETTLNDTSSQNYFPRFKKSGDSIK